MYSFLLEDVKRFLTGIHETWHTLDDYFLQEIINTAIPAIEARARIALRWKNIATRNSGFESFGTFSVDANLSITSGDVANLPLGGRVVDAEGNEFYYNDIVNNRLEWVYPNPLPFTIINPCKIIPDFYDYGYDYEWDDTLQPTLDLDTKPVRKIWQVSVNLVNHRMITIPTEWIQVHESGFSVVPFSAPGYVFGSTLVPMYGGSVPGGWYVAYSAGVTPSELKHRWGDLRMLAIKTSAVEVLKAVREGRHAGLGGISIPQMAIGESFTRFAQTIQSLELDVERILATVSTSYIFVA